MYKFLPRFIWYGILVFLSIQIYPAILSSVINYLPVSLTVFLLWQLIGKFRPDKIKGFSKINKFIWFVGMLASLSIILIWAGIEFHNVDLENIAYFTLMVDFDLIIMNREIARLNS